VQIENVQLPKLWAEIKSDLSELAVNAAEWNLQYQAKLSRVNMAIRNEVGLSVKAADYERIMTSHWERAQRRVKEWLSITPTK